MNEDNLEEYREYMIDPLDKPKLKETNKNQYQEIEKPKFKEPNQNRYQEIEKKPKVNKKKMSEIFIKKNYHKIKNKKFSFSGFFFGGSYFLYRKMYGEGILLLIITYLLVVVAPIELLLNDYQNYIIIPYIILLIINIIVGFITNKVYKNFVMKKLNKVRKLNLSYEESAKKCQKMGGTSFGCMLLINIIISTLLGYAMKDLVFSQFDIMKEDNPFTVPDNNEEVRDNYFLQTDGEIVFEDEFDPTTVFDFKLSKEFESGYIYKTLYEYSKNTIGKYAAIRFSRNKESKTFNNFMSSHTKSSAKKKINGRTWTVYDLTVHSEKDEYNDAFNYKIKYYVTEEKGISYIVKTVITDKGDMTEANRYMNEFIETLKLK